jgi:hypothetical protein
VAKSLLLRLMRTLFSVLVLLSVFAFKNHEVACSANIYLTEMNLVYEHVENRLSISVPGYSPSDVSVTVEGGIITKKSHFYVLKPSYGSREISVKVYVRTRDSILRFVGGQKFRVRPLPKPIPQLGGLPNNGKSWQKGAVVAQNRLIATYGPGFSYNLKTRVGNYKAKVVTLDSTYSFSGENGIVHSGLKHALTQLDSSDMVVFYAIEGLTYLEKDTLRSSLPSIVIPIR